MWITFKSCIFAFWNNLNFRSFCYVIVVNYIQILYLCILKQRDLTEKDKEESCELHSNLVSLHSETTLSFSLYAAPWLWITFKSCIFAFWNNVEINLKRTIIVVNYIQILYLCILKQRRALEIWLYRCCELHSNLVSLHSETTRFRKSIVTGALWITFKSCIFAFWNNIL